jgi:hypothetical protein
VPIFKRGLTLNPQSFNLNALGVDSFPVVASIGQGIANTAIQAYWISPCMFKIAKVAVFASAIDAVTGTDAFNIVVGTTGAYTQGNIAANDNSIAGPSVSVGSTYPTSAIGGMGYPTNVAAVGNSVFAADVPFQSTTAVPFPYVGAGAGNPGGNGQGWKALATTGLYGLLIPTNYDAVYPEGVPLTLRVSTVASTGSISNLLVAFTWEPVARRGAPISVAGQVVAQPGLDF